MGIAIIHHAIVLGLVYVIDRQKGNCTIFPLAKVPQFDVLSIDENHVRMKTMMEFFGVDERNSANLTAVLDPGAVPGSSTKITQCPFASLLGG